ncbi:MAG: glycosyltransferase [Alphaproteobacteria bacterium]|nr:glycosyltransferase [Alphaproteobacteria bacterium]
MTTNDIKARASVGKTVEAPFIEETGMGRPSLGVSQSSLNMKHLRVVHFAETLKGGPATHLQQLLPFQVSNYGQVAVFCPESHSTEFDVPGVDVHTTPDRPRNVSGLLALRKAWQAHLDKHHYDIIHLQSTFAGFLGRTLRRPSGTGIVYCARGWSFAMDSHAIKKTIYGLAERALMSRTDAIINISQDEADQAAFYGISGSKCVTVYNGIEDALWVPLEAPITEPLRLLYVGRYDRQKGVDILIEAMSRLDPARWHLTLVGGRVRAGAETEAFLPHVTNLGWQKPDRIRQELAKAHAVVIPSRWEGFGFVAAEAMRAGRAIAASAVGGLKEIVIEGKTGTKFTPNSSDAIVAGLERLREMDLPALGRAGRARYESLFTSDRMFAGIDRVYRRVLGAHE